MKPSFLTILPLLGTVLTTAPAHAGSWKIELDYDGKSVSGTKTQAWAYDDENGITQGAGVSIEAPGSTQSGSTLGRFVLLLRWLPAFAGEKIPPRVGVRIQQTVQGNGGRQDMSAFPNAFNPAPGSPGSVTLSTKVTSPNGTTYSDSAHEQKRNGYYSYSSLSRNPWAIVVVPTQGATAQAGGGSIVRYPLPSVEGTVRVQNGSYEVETDPQVFDTYSDRCWAGVTARVDYALDNREVKLTRGGRYEREELKNGEWHVYGDSIYSAHNIAGFPIYDFKPELSINVGYGNGDWGVRPDGTMPYVSPKWSVGDAFSSSFEQSVNRYKGYSKYGTPVVSDNSAQREYSGSATGPEEKDILYEAKDTRDGATSTAHYHLTLHDPIENIGGDSFTPYDIYAPVMNGGATIRRTYAVRPDGTPEVQPDVEIGESTEIGVGVTATVGIGLEQKLLGFETGVSGEASLKSTFTVTTSAKVPAPPLNVNEFKFLMAHHKFQRRHVRFWKYDEAGEVRRTITRDNSGTTYNPPLHVYHEAFKDSKVADPTYFWSEAKFLDQKDVNEIPPTTPKPELNYDYPSAHSS